MVLQKRYPKFSNFCVELVDQHPQLARRARVQTHSVTSLLERSLDTDCTAHGGEETAQVARLKAELAKSAGAAPPAQKNAFMKGKDGQQGGRSGTLQLRKQMYRARPSGRELSRVDCTILAVQSSLYYFEC